MAEITYEATLDLPESMIEDLDIDPEKDVNVDVQIDISQSS